MRHKTTLSPGWLKRDINESVRILLGYSPPTTQVASNALYSHIKKFSPNGPITKPHEIAWEITSDCNLRCQHCFVNDAKALFRNQDLTTEKCLSIIDQFKKLGVYLIIFSGGEPFLRNDFLDIIEHTKNNNISVVIHTNSLLLNDEIITRLNSLLHPQMDILQISLDGSTKETHETIRGRHTFEKTIDSIKRILQTNIKLRVHFTPTKFNVIELPDTYSLCSALEVTYFGLSDFLELRGDCNIGPDENVLLKAAAETKHRAANSFTEFTYQLDPKILYQRHADIANNYVTSLKEHIKHHKSVRCSSNFRSMVLKSDGRVFLCVPASYCDSDMFCLGDAKQEHLSDIWDNRVNNILYIGRDVEHLSCYKNKCEYFEKCRGGCVAKAYYYFDDINAPDPRCKIGA